MKNIENKVKLKVVSPGGNIKAGKMKIEFFRVNHSIPDCLGVAIQTPQGYVVYTGDFKIDQTPPDRKFSDVGRMTDYGKKGVLCLLSDSTNAEVPARRHQKRKQKQALKMYSVMHPGVLL